MVFTNMDLKLCKFKVRSVQQLPIHPLHLAADQVKWCTRFGRCESPTIAAISKQFTHLSDEPFVFAVVHLGNHPDKLISEETLDAQESSIPLTLYCTEDFFSHYELSANQQYNVSHIKPFPLEQVVFAAKTDETFNWSQQNAFETGLLVASTCNKSMLVRCGDVFLAPPLPAFGADTNYILGRFNELYAVQCEPAQQGIITVSTAVVVVKSQESVDNSITEEFSYTNLKIQILNESHLGWCKEDISSTIICSEYLASKLQLCNEKYVSVILSSNTIISKQMKPRTCMVRILSDKLLGRLTKVNCKAIPWSKHGVWITSTLWFNLSQGKPNSDVSQYSVTLHKLSEGDAPTFTSEVHLSLVLSPNYPPAGCYDKSIVNFLKNPILLTSGDIISLNVKDDIEFYEASTEIGNMCEVIYYKVISLGPDLTEGKSYLDGTTNSYVPFVNTTLGFIDGLPGLSKHVEALQQNISPYLNKNSVLQHVCTVLLSGQSGCGKHSVVTHVCNHLNLHFFEVDCQSLIADTPGATESKITDVFRRARLYSPCAIVMSSIESIGRNRETGRVDNRVCASLEKSIRSLSETSTDADLPVVVIATCNDKTSVVSDIRSLFLHQISIDAPDEKERYEMILHASRLLNASRDMDYHKLSKHTAGFVVGDIWELFRKSVQVSSDRVLRKCAVGSRLSWAEEQCLAMSGVTSNHSDVEEALKLMQTQRVDNIGMPKIPDVQWDDIGGLEDVKTHILDTIQLPMDHPELAGTGLNRSGVLLYGPPGTGKTLLAKAVASQCALSFLSVKGPELINMYVGQSEANVRRVFQKARDAAPCVVFFDELDALAPNRGRSGDSGGVMDRVVSQLLAELDGVNGSEDLGKQVFIIAASNRPDLIDPALLRPGRLDKLIYVGISENKEDQLKVLIAQTRKLNLAPTVSLEEVVHRCPPNMTGADFYALTTEAATNAVRRRIQESKSHFVDDMVCAVEQCDLLDAATKVIPSVNEEQLANYRRVKSVMAR
ncbi:peroxisomal ATPase PEX6-like isoform X2 [Ciona intestinalis]